LILFWSYLSYDYLVFVYKHNAKSVNGGWLFPQKQMKKQKNGQPAKQAARNISIMIYSV